MAGQPTMPKAVSSLQSVQRSYTSELSAEELVSCEPRREEKGNTEEVNLEFSSNQDSVGKGCQKSGCGGYSDCRVVVIYSVVSCKTEGSPERLSCTWL
jgi:hypothetical protein